MSVNSPGHRVTKTHKCLVYSVPGSVPGRRTARRQVTSYRQTIGLTKTTFVSVRACDRDSVQTLRSVITKSCIQIQFFWRKFSIELIDGKIIAFVRFKMRLNTVLNI